MVLTPAHEETLVFGCRLDALRIDQLARALLDDGGAAITQRALAHLRQTGTTTRTRG